jgi:hypothetical protein
VRRSPVKYTWREPDRAPEEKLSIIPALLLVTAIVVACIVGWFWL